VRRVWDFIPLLGDIWVPFVFHFDFVDTATGQPVLSSERQKSVRDRYPVDVPDPRVDFRVAASIAVALTGRAPVPLRPLLLCRQGGLTGITRQ
jgi:hypothetical protein